MYPILPCRGRSESSAKPKSRPARRATVGSLAERSRGYLWTRGGSGCGTCAGDPDSAFEDDPMRSLRRHSLIRAARSAPVCRERRSGHGALMRAKITLAGRPGCLANHAPSCNPSSIEAHCALACAVHTGGVVSGAARLRARRCTVRAAKKERSAPISGSRASSIPRRLTTFLVQRELSRLTTY